MLSLLPLLVGLAAADSVPAPRLLPPPEQQRTAAGASVTVHRQPALPIVALRLALLADDPPGYAGAGHLFQHLVYGSLQDQVARVGGRVQVQRTSDAIAFTVTGPASELDHLAAALRSTLRVPPAGADLVLRASRELSEERMAEWEIAGSHVRAALRGRLFPADISPAGTDHSAARFESRGLASLWAEMYRPERISVIAVGDVQTAEVRQAFADLPAPPSAARLPTLRDTVSLLPLAPAEATRAWLGHGWLASEMDPVALSITARLLRDEVRARLPAAEVEVEHWWTHHGQALALVVSAPENQTSSAQRVMGTAISGLRTNLTEGRIQSAGRAIRRDMLFYARTPDRMAEVIGQFADRSGDPEAAQRFYAELTAVDEDRVREVLDELLERTPARVEIAPQRLRRR
jgi:predicted Zn-dependent peptidase